MSWLMGLESKVWLIVVGALLAIVALLGVFNYARGLKIDGLQSDLKVCRADVAIEQGRVRQCQADVRVWEGKVNEQNAAIQKVKAEAAARAQESARLLVRARAAAATSEVKVRELEAKLAAPTPPAADARQAVQEVRSQLDLGGSL